jgi:uncharacterized membrane protein YhaH (DUF805 family)
MEWYLKVVKENYANFNGRARRKEFWMFVLFNIIFSIVTWTVDAILGTYIVFSTIYGLAILIPSLAVTVRRLHDIGKSGLWIFIEFIPFIGWIWLLILLAQEGIPGPNEYGPNPKDISDNPQQPENMSGNPIS